jgi:hypothetical protein
METSPEVSLRSSADRSVLLQQQYHFQQELKRFNDRGFHDPDRDLQLQRTIVAYNNVMASIHQLDQSLRVDPIDKLPRELLGNILKDYVFDGSSGWYHYVVCKALLLTLVSKRWRDFVLSEPMLWTEVILLTNLEDFEVYFWLSINLSGQLPLHIYVECCFDKWKEVGPCLFEHRERIEKLTWGHHITSHWCTGNKKDIINISSLMPPMPNLLEINPRERYDGEKIVDVFRSFPSLSRVNEVRFSRENLSERTWLREIETECSLYEVLKARGNLPNLETISFGDDLGDGGEWSIQADAYLETHQFLLKWRSLKYPRLDLPMSLLYHVPLLTTLQLWVTFSTFTKIMATLNLLQLLKTLDITILLSHDKLAADIPCLSQVLETCQNASVDTLKLDISCSSRQCSPEIHDKYFIIYDILTRALPHVQHLESRSWEPDFALFSLERLQFPLLEDAYVSCWNPHIPSIQVRVSNQIRDLRIKSVGDVLPCLSNTSSIRYFTWKKNYSDAVSKLDVTLWPSLEVLEVRSNWIDWNLGSLQHLRSITFNECDKTLPKAVEENADRLIKLLATESNSCPLLERIHFSQFPEWDLLFILLRRRNILNGPHVTPISFLSFPSKAPFFIIKPLRQLLKGMYPDIPPLRDLSLAGNVEIMLDREM